MRAVQRVLAAPLVGLIVVYQRFVSPLTPPTCRYYPSCSAYALTAIRRFGPFKGTWLALRRLGRCHPWSPGGVDHVPAAPDSAADSAADSPSTARPARPARQR
ncbi:membrane protein insertion efficiency factor YidD [Pedococcus sp. 5OH_020]|uniref:membrane protein insertion efficiency factor YidD n=1 Tax=Pedococcus sp. 5OH_020 TaxID=2989814 RepID=UPI0022E9FD54|nr:membrane protein insertion efficiency factor YidD [Pedococcus sp. 5OH_020]